MEEWEVVHAVGEMVNASEVIHAVGEMVNASTLSNMCRKSMRRDPRDCPP